VQATLLVELGRWSDAEALLAKARSEFEAVMPVPGWHPDIALADLRVRQGRCSEAEELLLGKDQSMQALLPTARLHLTRGDHDLAVSSAQRGLRVAGNDRLRAVELLVALVCAELGRGDVARAAAAADDLATRVRDLGVPLLEGRAAIARARVRDATGNHDEATALVREALDIVDRGALPWLYATLLVELARTMDASGDGESASHAATDALRELAGLDVVVSEADATLLDRLTRAAKRPGADSPATMTRDNRGWVVAHDGTTTRLPDSKGMRYVAELVRQSGREQHALDLVDRVEGLDGDGGLDRRSLGSAGDLSDSHARAAYRRRIECLRADIDGAFAEGRLDAAESMQVEIDQLIGELAHAFGLGGRSRQAASAAERARLNVTRAIRTAIARITDLLPAGQVLDQRIRTGLYCAYEPEDADEIRWIVQS
jgi:tetratricopeptide (TPR) repeat protein